MQYVVDETWERYGRVVIGGSPLHAFRLTAAGESVAAAIEDGSDVEPSRLVDRLVDAGAIHPVVPEHASTFTIDDVTVVTPQLGGTTEDDGRITVDDASSPPLVGARLRLDHNAGPAAARNAGRELVATPLIAFVDADVDTLDELGGGCWMTPLLAHFDDPRVGLVAPRVCGEPDSPLDLGTRSGRIRAGTRIAYAPAAALLVRTAAFDEVGGFDETLRHGEDVDLLWRLDAAGWQCRYDPSSAVWHEPRHSPAARLHQHADYGTSAAPLAIRHPHALAPARSNGWTAATWGLVAAGHPVIAGSLAVGSALALTRMLPDVPARVSFRIAMHGHLRAAGQLAAAIRREWWPIVALAALGSKRMRMVAVAAALARPKAVPTDVAYGWGVWRGMLRSRTIAPIVPEISSWPPRPSTRRSAATRRWRDAAAR